MNTVQNILICCICDVLKKQKKGKSAIKRPKKKSNAITFELINIVSNNKGKKLL